MYVISLYCYIRLIKRLIMVTHKTDEFNLSTLMVDPIIVYRRASNKGQQPSAIKSPCIRE